MEGVAGELADLIKRINKTNSATVVTNGKTLSDVLAERDVLALRRAAYNDLALSAAIAHGRLTRSEI